MAVHGYGLIDGEEDQEDNAVFVEHRNVLNAILAEDVDALEEALDNMNGRIDEPIEDGNTALHLACSYGDISSVEVLLDRGANLEVKNHDGALPLHVTTSGDVVELLRNRANSPETVQRWLETVDEKDGNTPLHYAARGEHEHAIRLLLASGASATTTNKHGKTPTELARPGTEARQILEAAVRYSLSLGLVGRVERDSNIPPHLWDHSDIPPHLCDLFNALETKNVVALRRALDNLSGSIDEKIENGDTALHLACFFGQLSCVELLLDRGANLEVENEDGALPFHLAAGGGFLEVVQLLLNRANSQETVFRWLETVDCEGDTPLHYAARCELVDVIGLLLSSGASVKKRNKHGKNPTELAGPNTEAKQVLEAADRCVSSP